MENTKLKTNYNEVFSQIRAEIISGSLKGGDKLPTEREMASQMGLSRTSVREGLKALEIMGIVESRQGGGNYITVHPEDSINDTLCIMFSLTKGKLDDLLEFRKVLELEACRSIIQKARDTELKSLETYIRLPSGGSSGGVAMTVEALAAYDSSFHMALLGLSDNVLYKYLYKTLFELIQQYFQGMAQVTHQKAEQEKTYQEHLAILNALKSRDIHQLELAIDQHIRLEDTYRESLPQYTHLGIFI